MMDHTKHQLARATALCVPFVIGVVGCVGGSGGDGGGTSTAAMKASASERQAACMAVSACGEMAQDCEQLFDLAVLDSACASEIETASCEDHASSAPPFLDTCFPGCTSESQACTAAGDAVVACRDVAGELRELLLLCDDVCEANGRTWSGSCGDSYMGQPSSDGGDVCWCE